MAASQEPAVTDTVRVAVLRDWPPHFQTSPDGQPGGFAIDVVNAVARRAHFVARFIPFATFSDAVTALQNGAVQVLPDFGIVASRSDSVRFTRSFEAFRVSVFTRSTNGGVTSLDDLAGRRVGVVRSNVASELLTARGAGADLVTFEDPREALFAILSADVDAVAYPEEVFQALARAAGVEERVRALPTPLGEIRRGMAVRADRVLLAGRLDTALEDFENSPEYGEIYRRWFAPPAPFWTTGRVMWTSGALLLLVLGVMAAWRYLSVTRLARELTRSMEERDREAEARREESERFRQIAERIKDVFWITSASKERMEYVSPAYPEVWGLPPERLYEDASSWIATVHDEDRERVTAALDLQQTGQYDIEYRIVRPDGEVRWIHDRAYPMRDEEGEIYRVIGVARDVTQRVQDEMEIQARERRFRAFVENASDLISTLDAEGRMLYQSPPLTRLLGHKQEDLLGRSAFDLIHPDDVPAMQDVWKAVLARPGQSMPTGTFRFRHRDGSWRIWDATLTNLLLEPAVGAVLSNARDVTEREALSHQFHQSQKLEAVGRLAGGIAHDFNNLLTVIRSQVDLLLVDLEGQNPMAADLELVQSAARRATELTSQLLAFSRDQLLRPQVLSLCPKVREVAQMLTRVLGKDIGLELDLPAGLPLVRVDLGRLEQVVLNLAVNARDAMPQGGTLTLRAYEERLDDQEVERLGGSQPGRFAVLQVTDTGTGMDAATLRRIFEPFFTTKPVGVGTGLGLAMAYGFLRQSGGHIRADSEVGVGTSFFLYFPVTNATQEELERTPAERPTLPPAAGTIVLIEDDPDVRHVTVRILKRAGFEVRAFESGEAGLAALKGGGPVDLVLTDLILGEIGGRKIVEYLREGDGSVPVVVMSGYADDSPGHPGDLPADIPFIQKPFTAEHLVDTVRRVMDGSRDVSGA